MSLIKPILIAVGGASGSGKSYLCEHLKERLSTQNTLILSMDNYYHYLSGISKEKRAEVNFDHPDSLDSELIKDHLSKAILGKPFQMPIYNFRTHTRDGQFLENKNYEYMIIDGLFSLYWSDIRNMIQLKIFIDLPADQCLKRRITRDSQDRGRTKESVISQFNKTVLPMYNLYVHPTKKYADLIVRGDSPVQYSIEKIVRLL